MEVLALSHVVSNEQKSNYTRWANATYKQMVSEAHMIRSGNLDRLKPVMYNDNISRPDPPNPYFVPDIERTEYYPLWHYSPPPITFALINWNIGSVYADVVQSLQIIRNETVVTKVQPYSVAVRTAMTEAEHAEMHSKLPESHPDHPHSFVFTPIHEDVRDDQSKIVSGIGAAVAWDSSMRDLLPKGVEGIYAVIKNNCNQSFTYIINGGDAIYKGMGDLSEVELQEYETRVDLSLHTHPNFTTTDGHCQFTMVRLTNMHHFCAEESCSKTYFFTCPTSTSPQREISPELLQQYPKSICGNSGIHVRHGCDCFCRVQWGR
jgi:hypothetical protein